MSKTKYPHSRKSIKLTITVSVKDEPETADRKAFYLIWLAIIGLAVYGYFRYRKVRSRFWKYCYNDYKL
jgi:hypothetical protein